MMKVVIITGAIRLQSSSQIFTTNKPQPSFLRPDGLRFAQQQRRSTEENTAGRIQ